MGVVSPRSSAAWFGVAAIVWAACCGLADARSFGAGRSPGKTVSVVGTTPLLDRRAIVETGFSANARVYPVSIFAQERTSGDGVLRALEAKGFSRITGLMRRGENYVFLADNAFGMRVRVVMNAKTGEIVGLSPVRQRQ